ncbi:MAG: tail-specific protease, partial [Ignavibacteriaceae bacterium]
MNKTILNLMKIFIVTAIIIFAANFFFADPTITLKDQANTSDTLTTLEPKSFYPLEDQLITTMLSRYHFKHFQLDDSLSSMIFDKYIKNLDYGRVYFYKSDIAELEKERYSFDDYLLDGNVQPFFDIFNLYDKRMME